MALTLIRRAGVLALLLVPAGLGLPAKPTAQRAATLEYAVKAEFLYNFLAFIEWPHPAFQQPADPFHLCISGTDPFGSALEDAVRGERIGGHPIVIDRLKDGGLPGVCHLVFVSKRDDARLASVVKSVERRGVLVVGESRRALELCGAIAFVVDGDRVRFDVNLAALAAQRLKASSKLLRVAREASDHFPGCGR